MDLPSWLSIQLCLEALRALYHEAFGLRPHSRQDSLPGVSIVKARDRDDGVGGCEIEMGKRAHVLDYSSLGSSGGLFGRTFTRELQAPVDDAPSDHESAAT